MQAIEVWAIGIILSIIILLYMLMRKTSITKILFFEIIVLCTIFLFEKSLCPFYPSPEKNLDSYMNSLYNSLKPLAQLKSFYISSSNDIRVEHPESAAFFSQCLTKLIGYLVIDFSCACIISAAICNLHRKYFSSWLVGFAISVGIVLSKIVAYCNMMLDSYHFFDTTEIIVCALGATVGVLCSKIIIDYHKGKTHE